MAKRIMLLALCLMLLATAGAKGEDSGVCMIVATDLHYLASELTDGGAYFSNLIEKSDGKVMAYSEELILSDKLHRQHIGGGAAQLLQMAFDIWRKSIKAV